jgi:hypothetical protein
MLALHRTLRTINHPPILMLPFLTGWIKEGVEIPHAPGPCRYSEVVGDGERGKLHVPAVQGVADH